MQAPLNNVVISPLGHLWVVEAPIEWDLLRADSGLTITVPVGFTTDLASIPPFARWLLNPEDGTFARAAIIHDYLVTDLTNSRFQAAGVFYDVLRVDGNSPLKAFSMATVAYLYTAAIWPILHKFGVP